MTLKHMQRYSILGVREIIVKYPFHLSDRKGFKNLLTHWIRKGVYREMLPFIILTYIKILHIAIYINYDNNQAKGAVCVCE